MTSIVEASAVELARMISERELSAREVVRAHLDRIDETNEAVNAMVSMRSRADVLAEADAADAQTATGSELGPLHGLPVGIKDLNDVAGLPTRSGSRLTSARSVDRDDLTVARLRAAGAIVVGKTNTPEFGTGSHTFNEVFGLTRNPWNLDRSAGGSSGGAAAALAARMLPIADGSDLGGSLRNPAGFCNVVGLRPSIGRVPEDVDVSTHLIRLAVQGPMGRTVGDTALVLSVMAGSDPRDPLSLAGDPAEFRAPLPDHTAARVGWAGDLDLFVAEPEVLQLCRTAAARVELAGGEMVEARPDLSDAMDVFRTLRGLGYRRLGREVPPQRWGLMKATVRENIEYGRTLDVDDVLRAERLRAKVHHEMTRFFETHDVLALPTAQVAPFPADWEFPVEVDGTPMADYLDWMTTCCIITPTGCPAISIPAGFTEAGLPVGLQLVAPIGQERRLLEIAHAIESVEPFHRLSPSLSPG